jgi:hypothetical protein
MKRGTLRGRMLLAVFVVAIGALALGAASASAAREVVYSNIVSPLPGNYASVGFAATSTSQYGGEIELAGTDRKGSSVTVAMSTWACQYGNWETNTCATPKPKKKFKWPLTLNVYEVGAGGAVGAQVASITREVRMPYRPSVSAKCATAAYEDPGAWYDEASNSCFHGLAFTVRFPLGGVTLPAKAIVSVAYNTSNYGADPAGDSTACYSEPQGCYYDSLNVATVEPSEDALTVGTDPTESQYVDSNWSEMYCGKTESLDTFAPSGVCAFYEGDQPAFEVIAH